MKQYIPLYEDIINENKRIRDSIIYYKDILYQFERSYDVLLEYLLNRQTVKPSKINKTIEIFGNKDNRDTFIEIADCASALRTIAPLEDVYSNVNMGYSLSHDIEIKIVFTDRHKNKLKLSDFKNGPKYVKDLKNTINNNKNLNIIFEDNVTFSLGDHGYQGGSGSMSGDFEGILITIKDITEYLHLFISVNSFLH